LGTRRAIAWQQPHRLALDIDGRSAHEVAAREPPRAPVPSSTAACNHRLMQSVTPYLLYEDSEAAIEFLVRAFGFHEKLRHTAENGRVNHAELELGHGQVFIGSPGGDYRTPERSGVLVHVYVDDVDEHFARARDAGATIVDEPKDQPYGDRSYHAEDPEGQSWHFAQHMRDVKPQEWGGQVTG
jgi:PhnB protein